MPRHRVTPATQTIAASLLGSSRVLVLVTDLLWYPISVQIGTTLMAASRCHMKK